MPRASQHVPAALPAPSPSPHPLDRPAHLSVSKMRSMRPRRLRPLGAAAAGRPLGVRCSKLPLLPLLATE